MNEADFYAAIDAADSYREERDEARAMVTRLQAQLAEMEKLLKAKKKAEKQGKKRPQFDLHMRQRIARAADMIHTYFIWDDTEQGQEFWAERFTALQELAAGAEIATDWDVENPAHAMTSCMTWSKTPQGHEYWELAYRALRKMYP